jgi:hypothetical protein
MRRVFLRSDTPLISEGNGNRIEDQPQVEVFLPESGESVEIGSIPEVVRILQRLRR